MRFLAIATVVALVHFALVPAHRISLETPTEQKNLRDWTPIGRATGEELVKITFALKQNNVELLEAYLMEVSNPASAFYGKYLNIEDLTAMVRPSDENIQVVMKFLDDHQVTDYALTPTNDFIVANIPASTAEMMFATPLLKYQHKLLNKFAVKAESTYTVPAQVSKALDFVSGIARLPNTRVKIDHTGSVFRRANFPAPEATPQFLREIYSIPEKAIGGNPKNSQAVTEFLEQYYDPADLNAYFDRFNITRVEVAKVTGENNVKLPGGEATLDIEVILGVAPKVPTWFMSYSGRRNNSEAPSDYNQEPFLDWLIDLTSYEDVPLVHSVSYSDDEEYLPLEFMERVNVELMKAGARGLTILVAAGDDGVGGMRVRNTGKCSKAAPQFPSSSPWVLSIGGTQVGGPNNVEIVSDSKTGSVITTGGGFSDNWPIPEWQAAAVKNFLETNTEVPPESENFFTRTGRAYPDISAIATNYPIVLSGNVVPIGGTSASTPVVAAIVALLNEERLARGQSPMGFINPWLYKVVAQDKSTVQDVVSGDNKCSAYASKCCTYGFSASEGWDAATGLGTPNLANLLKYI
eukprot:Colp12_sorted_trinity150504_noHs@17101